MTVEDLILEKIREADMTYEGLAQMAGYAGSSGLHNMLKYRKHGMRLDRLISILDVLGCELIVRDPEGREYLLEERNDEE